MAVMCSSFLLPRGNRYNAAIFFITVCHLSSDAGHDLDTVDGFTLHTMHTMHPVLMHTTINQHSGSECVFVCWAASCNHIQVEILSETKTGSNKFKVTGLIISQLPFHFPAQHAGSGWTKTEDQY